MTRPYKKKLIEVALPLEAVREQVRSALDLVVQVARRSAGRRAVIGVDEVLDGEAAEATSTRTRTRPLVAGGRLRALRQPKETRASRLGARSGFVSAIVMEVPKPTKPGLIEIPSDEWGSTDRRFCVARYSTSQLSHHAGYPMRSRMRASPRRLCRERSSRSPQRVQRRQTFVGPSPTL